MTTNYERIKAMSVEEMAEWMDKIELKCHLACIHKTDCYGYRQGEFICLESIKQWLLAESEE